MKTWIEKQGFDQLSYDAAKSSAMAWACFFMVIAVLFGLGNEQLEGERWRYVAGTSQIVSFVATARWWVLLGRARKRLAKREHVIFVLIRRLDRQMRRRVARHLRREIQK